MEAQWRLGVDPAAADDFVIIATSSASEPVDQQPFDRVLREPLRLVLPDGQIVEIPRPR